MNGLLMTKDQKERVLSWAERAQESAGRAHANHDFLAATRLMKTAERYRRLAYDSTTTHERG